MKQEEVNALAKKQLEKKRKKILERIVALDCTSGDYTKEVAELFAEKRKIEIDIKNL